MVACPGVLHRARTLVAVGTEDVVTPAANSELLVERIPNAQLALYPDSGHAFLVQYPLRFANQAHRFLVAK